jgi:hypothetical protein
VLVDGKLQSLMIFIRLLSEFSILPTINVRAMKKLAWNAIEFWPLIDTKDVKDIQGIDMSTNQEIPQSSKPLKTQ